VEAAGIELSHESTGKTANSETGGAESGALGAQETLNDPDLAAVVDAWPTLPQPIKAGILAMIGKVAG
jgi:hypothetical protein